MCLTRRGTRWRSLLRHCATRSRVRFPMASLEFLTQSFRPHYHPGVDSASNRNEYLEYFLGQRRPVRRAENPTTFICRLSWNLGASTSWNPQALSRPVIALPLSIFYRLTQQAFVTKSTRRWQHRQTWIQSTDNRFNETYVRSSPIIPFTQSTSVTILNVSCHSIFYNRLGYFKRKCLTLKRTAPYRRALYWFHVTQ